MVCKIGVSCSFKKIISIILKYAYVYMSVCGNVSMCLCRLENAVGFPVSRVTHSCELPDLGAGNKSPILWKSSELARVL